MIRALLLASLLVGADETFSVTVTVSQMRWGQKCGAVVTEALATLDGAAKVKRVKYIENQGIGTYTVTLPKTAAFSYKAVNSAIHSRYVIDRIQIKIEGELSRNDEGLWLTSGETKLKLKNRPKKDDKDAPPDLVSQLGAALKDGKTSFQIEGDVSRQKDATLVYLHAAQAVEKKKE